MAIVSQDVDERYWKVTDSDALPNGTFNINLKQVADYTGKAIDMNAPPNQRLPLRRTINRPNDVPAGTIVKVTETTTVERTLQVNPVA